MRQRVLLLDNLSLHKSKKLDEVKKRLATKGIKFEFLPPYTPWFNLIENYWHLL